MMVFELGHYGLSRCDELIHWWYTTLEINNYSSSLALSHFFLSFLFNFLAAFLLIFLVYSTLSGSLNIFQSIYNTAKYVISTEEDGLVHKLEIQNPVMADMGKYTCDINGVATSAYLDVESRLFKVHLRSLLCSIVLDEIGHNLELFICVL